jgi:hypothetical protein
LVSLHGFKFKHRSKRSCNIRPQKKPKWTIHEAIFTTTKRAVIISSRKEKKKKYTLYQLAKPMTIYIGLGTIDTRAEEPTN